MERPRLGTARRIGPYLLITRLDSAGGPGTPPVPERRFIARSTDGDRTVLVSAPLEGADPQRFVAEAEAARHPLGPWAAPVAEHSGPSPAPWCARPYLPALPLPTALAVYGGPLPEHTVRALGAALAGTLALAHAAGTTHAGVSPAAVLLAGDGPRLTCFGAVRAAGPDGAPRSGLPGLDPGALAPEQGTGGRPRPPGDVYALGAVLSYASTGHTVPDRDELPASLRPLITACLARDPAARPRAAQLLEQLAPSAAPAAAHGPRGTEIHAGAASLPADWLPGRLVAAVARQSAVVLAAELPSSAHAPAPAHRDN
ncbi:serine/threonine protein kinase [Streptomyces agglomeratus]|uniref:serine/threonine protein kinase n=1 Tax=Streptomyces agglomeratus TaxID=285458 RepID=UPI000854E9B0|nr:serine/threonine protein kinase [Streptomyces agglomeratus]OEJ39266.1 serine/threonine protein kinase [Streptomyces agglomeratus]OEJ46351.1 serine/threonine protein kinase [Streptomyces agglomeratus]OEJ51787.1 serine/threonine protein kinase [Streptomyces agglomeratus]